MAFHLGQQYQLSIQETIRESHHRMCISSNKEDAYLIEQSDGYVCFKQNVNTKRITKSLIATPDDF
jgi:hypothetical protein